MTPFGERMRALRAARGVTMREMADSLQVSPAYLSALEHGKRGRPSVGLMHQICQYFGLIWDDAEALTTLAELSHPKVVIDTSCLSAKATQVANRLGQVIESLDDSRLDTLLAELADADEQPKTGPTH